MKKLFSSTKAYLLLAGAAALMASCQDYEPANEQMTKEAAYNYEFERQFGPVDPNHDWSMATRVTANIDLSDAPEGTYEVKIFSEKNGYLLTKAIVENSAQISFDAIKGESNVRILARKTSALGLSVINAYFPIVDGVVNTANVGTRASTADNCETTVGDQIDLGTKDMGVSTYEYQPAANDHYGTFVTELPSDGKYYITTIAGEDYSNGANGKYLVTQNGTPSQKDMYEIEAILLSGNYLMYKSETRTIYSDDQTNWKEEYNSSPDKQTEYSYVAQAGSFGEDNGNQVDALPNDSKYYITKIAGEDYSDGSNGKYSVYYNGTTSQMDMYEVADIISNCTPYTLLESGKYSITYWGSPAYYKVNRYYLSVDGYNLAGGAYVIPAYYKATTVATTVKWAGDFYYLNDVYKSIDQETQVKFDDLLPLVSSAHPNPIFHEADDNRTIYEDVLDYNVELVLTENGPMTYTYVFYGSIYHNMLGYFYWNETEGMTDEEKKQARINAPRYVLMNDTWPEDVQTETGKPNLQCYNDQNGTNAHTPGGMEMPTWVDSGIEAHTGHYLQGTTYHMVYFGENYNEAGSYEFPKGLHVAFFLLTKATDGGAYENNKGTGLFYSIQDMNNVQDVWQEGDNYYFLNDKKWWGTSNVQLPDGTWEGERPNEGEVAAVFYSYKGNMVMGFEDDVDKDENDMLFLISAPVNPPVELSEEEEMTWIVACEDLGGTYDYDFNDLVFELTKDEITTHHIDPNTGEEVGEPTTTIEWFIRALAAGGTLPATVYYDNTAIGEIHSMLGSTDTGTPINVSPGTPSIGTLEKLENVAQEDQDDISKILRHIRIVVQNKNDQLSATEIVAPNKNKESNIPQMLLLPKGWDWPTEETLIYKVYPKFEQWTQDMTQNGWIEDPTAKGINTNFFVVNPNK